jgi:hypothetical protein
MALNICEDHVKVGYASFFFLLASYFKKYNSHEELNLMSSSPKYDHRLLSRLILYLFFDISQFVFSRFLNCLYQSKILISFEA